MAEDLDYVPMPDNVVSRDPEGVGGARSRTRPASRCSPRAQSIDDHDREKGAAPAPFPMSTGLVRVTTTCAAAARRPLEWRSQRIGSRRVGDADPPGDVPWLMLRCTAARSRPDASSRAKVLDRLRLGDAVFRRLTRAARSAS